MPTQNHCVKKELINKPSVNSWKLKEKQILIISSCVLALCHLWIHLGLKNFVTFLEPGGLPCYHFLKELFPQ